MKIALHNELPAEAQFKQLVDSIDGPAATAPLIYEVCSKSRRVIAAYDDERLVAIGRLVEGDGGQQFEFTVLPAYREREIEHYMRKLLML